MSKRPVHIQMAYDDVFFSTILIMIGLYITYKDWPEWNWNSVIVISIGTLWLGVRIYHLTHKDEVFRNES